MEARNRKTKAPITGTLERLSGRADIQSGSWKRNAKGELEFEHGGYTEIYWDDQRTVTDKDSGGPLFVDENGHAVTSAQIELHEERAGERAGS